MLPNIRTIAATAVAITLGPGSAFAHGTGDVDISPYLFAFVRPAPAVHDPLLQGTAVNAHVVQASDMEDIEAMLRVAHLLASESVDIDADIARLVDEEFWNLV